MLLIMTGIIIWFMMIINTHLISKNMQLHEAYERRELSQNILPVRPYFF